MLVIWLLLVLGFVQETPTIESFTVDSPVVDYVAVEAGVETADFSWRAVNLRDGDSMVMHALVGREWVLIGEGFAPVKTDTLVIAHPRDFGNPLYRLSIVTANGERVAEQQLALSYAPMTDPPSVNWVMPRDLGVAPDALQAGTHLPIHWSVSERPPNANMVFEQVLPGGEVVNIELPRAEAWVPALGSGVVAPLFPGGGRDVVLRLRVVDRETGETLAQRDQMVPVYDPDMPLPSVEYFAVTPSNPSPGDTVTLSWEITNGQRLFITETILLPHDPMDCKHSWTPDAVYEYLPTTGSLEVTLPDNLESGHMVRFSLIYSRSFVSDWRCVSYNEGEVIRLTEANGRYEITRGW